MALYQQALSQQTSGQLDKAIATYRKLLNLKPDFIAALCNLGAILHAGKDYTRAAECYRKVLKIKLRLPQLHYNLGAALPAMGDAKAAHDSYAHAVRLMRGSREQMDNLRRETGKHGLDASRLVFAEPLSKPQHLARHCHADLFLDTLYYNAHTTVSDALRMGVPMLTVPGQTFASRVGASLLTAVGLEDLIMDGLESYV